MKSPAVGKTCRRCCDTCMPSLSARSWRSELPDPRSQDILLHRRANRSSHQQTCCSCLRCARTSFLPRKSIPLASPCVDRVRCNIPSRTIARTALFWPSCRRRQALERLQDKVAPPSDLPITMRARSPAASLQMAWSRLPRLRMARPASCQPSRTSRAPWMHFRRSLSSIFPCSKKSRQNFTTLS